ncbi:hypothetical protein BD410DRAFT_873561 [Rickenella mellea]|uniref:Serine-threonine/tyrosine-protein kinase catalytic domain-containing protein n=1 Tax=Rickenella mellea TaxID=50990 RepID=A0A4Y7PY13_9AGAM|nr:hypothetical protein BD410DRAFT_857975 [Rickenella mellea]TDL19792.1 hypothetical protein BD410DRAFT_873561 [Rickenella mellea]
MALPVEIVRRVTFTDIAEFPSGAPIVAEDPLRSRIPPGKYHLDDSNLPILNNVAPLIRYHGNSKSWSRIYKASMLQPRSNQSVDVAVKLYEERFFPLRLVTGSPASPHVLRETDEVFAWTESWAYSKMQDLQGLIIPKFLGVFKFSNGTGAEIWGIITELVEGLNLRDYCSNRIKELGSGSWHDVARQTASAIHEIRSCGCANLDIRADNIIVSRTEPTKITIVDFATARPSVGPHRALFDNVDEVAFGQMVKNDICRYEKGPDLIHQWLFVRKMKNKYPRDGWVQSPSWDTIIRRTVKPHLTRDEWKEAGVPNEYDDEEYQDTERQRAD